MDCSGWYGSKTVGVGIVGRQVATMALEKGIDHIAIFLHSKNGRCTTLRSIYGLSEVGQPNVRPEWDRQ